MKIITFPGLIDPHVHFRDPEQTLKEDFTTGTAAALAGGYTTVIDMPNNKTPITNLKTLNKKIRIAKKKILCDVGMHFGSLGNNLSEFKKVGDKVIGLKLYLNETTGNFLIDKKSLEKIFTAWKITGKPVLVHAEDDAIAAAIKIARKTGVHVHFCHISLASDLRQIIQAKSENIRISCGVTPHHLFLTELDAKKLGPLGRMKPFLKTRKDVEFLWKNLNFIDVVESDHAPHMIEEKRGDIPPFGVPGLETTLPLLLNAVSESRLSLWEVMRLCYFGPSRIFRIEHDSNTKIEIDFSEKWAIKNALLKTKCGWTPFDGARVQGRVKRVFLRGKKVFEDGKVLAKAGDGRVVV